MCMIFTVGLVEERLHRQVLSLIQAYNLPPPPPYPPPPLLLPPIRLLRPSPLSSREAADNVMYKIQRAKKGGKKVGTRNVINGPLTHSH